MAVFRDGTSKEEIKVNEVIRMGPCPTGLVSI
jgi:hypothetical protein